MLVGCWTFGVPRFSYHMTGFKKKVHCIIYFCRYLCDALWCFYDPGRLIIEHVLWKQAPTFSVGSLAGEAPRFLLTAVWCLCVWRTSAYNCIYYRTAISQRPRPVAYLVATTRLEYCALVSWTTRVIREQAYWLAELRAMFDGVKDILIFETVVTWILNKRLDTSPALNNLKNYTVHVLCNPKGDSLLPEWIRGILTYLSRIEKARSY